MTTQVIVLNGGSSSGKVRDRAVSASVAAARDLVVDTTRTGALECAEVIAARVH